MLTHRHHRGLTLLELMVVVAIIAMMTALAMPGLRAWSANAQLRTTANVLQVSIKQAQAEAVKSFRQVVFFRTNDATCTGAETAVENGTRWVIKVLPLVSTGSATAAACGPMLEGAPTIAVTGPTAVCFNGNGRPMAMTTAQNGLGVACTTGSNNRIIYGLDSTTSTPNLKKLQVWLTLGGSVRSCEKTRALSADVPDGCPAINQSPTT